MKVAPTALFMMSLLRYGSVQLSSLRKKMFSRGFVALPYGLSRGALTFVTLCVSLLIGLRFYHLGLKPYWIDEAFTSFHLSGYSDGEVAAFTQHGQIRTVAEMLQFQSINAQHGWLDMLRHIGDTAPELPPFYFLLLRGWGHLFGTSATALRSFSALLGALLLPLSYGLGWVLYRDRRVAGLAVLLIGLSPFQLMLSQEARPYTLWFALLLIGNIALIQAQRYKRSWDWAIYGCAMVLAFYTHLLTLMFVLAQGVALLWMGPRKGELRSFLMIQGLLGLAIAPWIWWGFFRPHGATISEYVMAQRSLPLLLKGLLRGVSLTFLDFGLDEQSGLLSLGLFGAALGGLLGLIGLGVRHGWRTRDQWGRRLALILALFPPACIFTSDLILHSGRIQYYRYLGFSYMVLAVMIAAALVQATGPRLRKYRGLALVALILVSLSSCLTYLQHSSWWNKTLTQADSCIVTTTNPLDRPLLITDQFFVRTMAISHSLRPQVRFQILTAPRPQRPVQAFSNKNAPLEQTFLYLPSDALWSAFSNRYQLKRKCDQAFWSFKPTPRP
jgi:uncharacterized membrane protein